MQHPKEVASGDLIEALTPLGELLGFDPNDLDADDRGLRLDQGFIEFTTVSPSVTVCIPVRVAPKKHTVTFDEALAVNAAKIQELQGRLEELADSISKRIGNSRKRRWLR